MTIYDFTAKGRNGTSLVLATLKGAEAPGDIEWNFTKFLIA